MEPDFLSFPSSAVSHTTYRPTRPPTVTSNMSGKIVEALAQLYSHVTGWCSWPAVEHMGHTPSVVCQFGLWHLGSTKASEGQAELCSPPPSPRDCNPPPGPAF